MIIHIPPKDGVSLPELGRIIRIWYDNKWQAAVRIADENYFVGLTMSLDTNVIELLHS